MYCSNCGLQLPDWAHYCERCGARVHRIGVEEDPIDQVGLDNTSASEPLWVDDVPEETTEEPPTRGRHVAPPAEEPSQLTVPMDAAQAAAEEEVVEATEEPEAAEEPEAPEAAEEPAEEPAAPEPEPEPEPKPEPEAQPSEQPQPTERRTIDVGEQESPLSRKYVSYGQMPGTWQRGQHASVHYRPEPALSMRAIALAAAAALVLGLLVTLYVMGLSKSQSSSGGGAQVATERVSKKEAASVIEGLEGWWTTDRTYDGRYWHIQDAVMETYAADGQLAKQVLVDVASVQRMKTGPGGIEGAGYFLRDIGFFLLDSDADTLHAINGDGSADEDANLFRIEAPAFINKSGSDDASDEKKKSESDLTDEQLSSEFILPESATRVYDVSELESLSDHDLFVARNEIYARHGFAFEEGELSEYFKSKSWYHPSEVFNEGEISEIEHENVSTILALEQQRGSRYV